MNGGDVMSGIDPLLNMAPTHHNDDVNKGEKGSICCCINTLRQWKFNDSIY